MQVCKSKNQLTNYNSSPHRVREKFTRSRQHVSRYDSIFECRVSYFRQNFQHQNKNRQKLCRPLFAPQGAIARIYPSFAAQPRTHRGVSRGVSLRSRTHAPAGHQYIPLEVCCTYPTLVLAMYKLVHRYIMYVVSLSL